MDGSLIQLCCLGNFHIQMFLTLYLYQAFTNCVLRQKCRIKKKTFVIVYGYFSLVFNNNSLTQGNFNWKTKPWKSGADPRGCLVGLSEDNIVFLMDKIDCTLYYQVIKLTTLFFSTFRPSAMKNIVCFYLSKMSKILLPVNQKSKFI